MSSERLHCRLALALALALAATVGLSGCGSTLSRHAAEQGNGSSPPSRVAAAYARLPVSLVPNRGQLPAGFDFGAQGAGYSLGLRPDGMVLALSSPRPAAVQRPSPDPLALVDRAEASRPTSLMQMQLVGADPGARAKPATALRGTVNYLTGNDQARWQRRLPTYAGVTYEGVYPGVDVSYHGAAGQFEYDFVLAPGADPSVLDLAFAGVDGVRLDDHGGLVLALPGGELHHHAPVVHQDGRGGRVSVPGGFVIRDDGRVGFSVGPYDHRRPLVIDPTLAYSSFLGGSGFDSGLAITVDALGNAHLVGATASPDFPTTPGALATGFNGAQDAFVAMLNRDGSALLYSTFLGGSAVDDADSIAIGPKGDAYVRGITMSGDFPATPNAFDPTFNGGIDAYVAKLSPDGSSLRYSTFLGGSGFDSGSGIAVDRTGAAYVAGITGSPEFPTTPGAYQTTFHGVGGPLPPTFGSGDYDAYLTKLDPTGTTLEYSTFLGGSRVDVGFKVALDALDQAYVAGMTMSSDFPTTAGAFDRTFNGARDAFVTKFTGDGSALLYSTFLGGSGPEGALGLAVDPRGSAYVTGGTGSPDFPTTAGAVDQTFNGDRDVYVTALSPDGSALVYSTLLGGSGSDGGNSVAVNSAGEAFVAGDTTSPDFPTTPGAVATAPSGDADAFLAKLGKNGTTLAYSTYLGGSGFDSGAGVAVDPQGAAYVTGETDSADFPTTAGALDSTLGGDADAFVTKIFLSGT